MPTRVKKNRAAFLAAIAASQAVCLLALAQNAPAPGGPGNKGGLAPAAPSAPAGNQPPSASAMLNENATEIDSSTSQALKSIFETKPA